jgi:hypothetical protein
MYVSEQYVFRAVEKILCTGNKIETVTWDLSNRYCVEGTPCTDIQPESGGPDSIEENRRRESVDQI